MAHLPLKQVRFPVPCLLAGGMVLAFFAGDAFATDTPASPDGGNLSSGRSVIGSGGGDSTGGDFSISGTFGQADVDPMQPSTGGTFAITGGFWFTESPRPDSLFTNGFEQ